MEPRSPQGRRQGDSSGPGVPEALPRVLLMIERRLGVDSIDRLWIFPPLIQGRREWGVVAVSAFLPAEDRRRLLTAAYSAEQTGGGIQFDAELVDEGEAPPQRLPTVMLGVVRRSEVQLGDPREVRIEGRGDSLDKLFSEFDPVVLEAAAGENRS